MANIIYHYSDDGTFFRLLCPNYSPWKAVSICQGKGGGERRGREGEGGGERVAMTHFFFLHFAERIFTPTPPISCIQHLLLLHGSGSVLIF